MRVERPALSEAVEHHAEFLLRAALGMGFSMPDAEDLVQETFGVYLEKSERFEGRSALRTYLYGILYRKGLEKRRKGAREIDVDPADAVFESRFAANGHWQAPPRGPDEEALTGETARLIAECLDTLSESQRAAFTLREVEGQSSEDICNSLGISATNLRVLLFRARNKTRECLEKKWEGGNAAV